MSDIKKASDFMGCLFLARDVVHSVHLNTRSYAKHKALQKFYDNIIDLADGFAECYQGKHGLIGAIGLQSAKKTTNVVAFLESQVEEIEECRYEICDKNDSTLQNLIDGILELYYSTLYKLKFLA